MAHELLIVYGPRKRKVYYFARYRELTGDPEREAGKCIQSVGSLIVLDKLQEVSKVLSYTFTEQTLQWFLQPPPLSSVDFGGLHFQDHSKDTD